MQKISLHQLLFYITIVPWQKKKASSTEHVRRHRRNFNSAAGAPNGLQNPVFTLRSIDLGVFLDTGRTHNFLGAPHIENGVKQAHLEKACQACVVHLICFVYLACVQYTQLVQYIQHMFIQQRYCIQLVQCIQHVQYIQHGWYIYSMCSSIY